MWRPSSTAATAASKRSNRPPSQSRVGDNLQAENKSSNDDRDGSEDKSKDTSVPRRPGLLTRQQSALSEALKGNPFRSGNNSRDNVSTKSNGSATAPKAAIETKTESKPDPVDSLNKDLRDFARIYPDVQIEVLRELLARFDGGDSRLHISVEQLFRYKHEWARGRLLSPPRDIEDEVLHVDLFRREGYKDACKNMLYAEFKSPLSKSTIDAVLAEVNHGYRKARPILQDLAAKTWRVTITNFLFSRRKKSVEEIPPALMEKTRDGLKQLRLSGDVELDAELEDLFVTPARERQDVVRRQGDMQMAKTLNQREAERANALFECQCCYDEVPFEQVTACTTEGHFLCVDCVHRTLSEALFGQGWAKSVDATLSTLNCIASTPTGECQGHISHGLLRDTITNSPSGRETWLKFEQRLATENLSKANLQLTCCPFCSYAEVSETPTLDQSNPASTNIVSHTNQLDWRFHVPRPTHISLSTILLFVLIESLLPAVLITVSVLYFMNPAIPRRLFHTSLLKLHANQRTSLFKCKNPLCLKKSCLKCHKHWRDPHTCHEPLILSLRTTVEAARTAALKRTCPRCGTSFVKSSGCNKLVCVCGYAMCYICRKNIGKVNPRAAGQANGIANANANADANFNFNFNFNLHMNANRIDEADQDVIAAGEGYRHFCPHFRPTPGTKCTECDKCDLYKTEDEDAMVRRAGEQAEFQWREKYLTSSSPAELDPNSTSSSNAISFPVSKHHNDNGSDKKSTSKPRTKADLQRLEDALAGIGERDARTRTRHVGVHGDGSFIASVTYAWKEWQSGRVTVQSLVDYVVERCVVIVDERVAESTSASASTSTSVSTSGFVSRSGTVAKGLGVGTR